VPVDDESTTEAEPASNVTTESTVAETDLTTITDDLLAIALRDVMAFESDQTGKPISPATWRRRFRQALERAGGPHLDAKSMSRLIRSRLLPRRLIEPTGASEPSNKKLRPYLIRRNHPNVIALLSRNSEDTSATEA
jgi:hypothetical protein